MPSAHLASVFSFFTANFGAAALDEDRALVDGLRAIPDRDTTLRDRVTAAREATATTTRARAMIGTTPHGGIFRASSGQTAIYVVECGDRTPAR
jgi:hypothetical protein